VAWEGSKSSHSGPPVEPCPGGLITGTPDSARCWFWYAEAFTHALTWQEQQTQPAMKEH